MHLGAHGRDEGRDGQRQRRRRASMEELIGKEREGLGNQSNGHGFVRRVRKSIERTRICENEYSMMRTRRRTSGGSGIHLR